MDNESCSPHTLAIAESERLALQSVLDLKLPLKIYFSEKEFEPLGVKIHKQAFDLLMGLRKKHGDLAPYLMAIAVRQSWFACYSGASYIELMFDGDETKNFEYFQGCSSPDVYADFHGWAWTLTTCMSDLSEHPEYSVFREGTPFKKNATQKDILECLAVYWLKLAAEAHISGKSKDGFNWIYEAHQALHIAEGVNMFDEADTFVREVGEDVEQKRKKFLSTNGSKGAMTRSGHYAELQSWILDNAKPMRGSHKEIADKLYKLLPENLGSVSKSPERYIYDLIRKPKRVN